VRPGAWTTWLAATLLIPLCGCPIFPGVEDGNRDAPLFETTGKLRGEPNDTFQDAITVLYDDEGVGHLQGTIRVADDVDVYDLGPMEPGDRIVVDVDTDASELDAMIAIFDADERLFMDNDDEDLAANLLDPYIDQIVRHASDHYYLGITSSAFAPSVGRYTITVTVERGGPVPPPQPQILLLDFDGGTILIPGMGTFTVGPFDAADIDPAYAGKTDELKAGIIAHVEQDFAPFDVLVLNTDEDDPPAPGTYSTVLFGEQNNEAYGVAEQIDHYNADPDDAAIVFTGSFSPTQGGFSHTPTIAELATAIGNVASHEAAHLLGLNHVTDPTALMDATGGPDTLLADQQFKLAPLDDAIFPLGQQDALLLPPRPTGRPASAGRDRGVGVSQPPRAPSLEPL